MTHFNSSAFRFNESLLPHYSNQNIKTNFHMIKTIVHSAGGGCGGGGGCRGGRAGAGMYHTSCSTGGVGAAADEVALAPPPAVGGGATSEVRGDAHAMICKDNALDTASLTSFAIPIHQHFDST